jgi:tocopherol O-methyltransferase
LASTQIDVLRERHHYSLGIHFGYYDDQHRDHDAAVLNINRKLADVAGISKQDRVLDAGCGIGGSSLWLAANRRCRVVGINIVPWQIQQAQALAAQRGLQALADFQLADYADTKLKADSFTVVWGLESVVHAADKQAVIQEAYRLLQPGGRLVIAEYMLTINRLAPSEQAN